MRKLILDVILRAGRALTVDEIAVQLVVRHGVSEDITLDQLRAELEDMQRGRLVASRSDGTHGVTAIARKLVGEVPCKRKGE